MTRTSGVDLPRGKCVEIGLICIYGIDVTSSSRTLSQVGVDPNTRVKDLTDGEARRIAEVIVETQTVESDLRRQIAMDTKRLVEVSCCCGIHHRKGLLARDQGTRMNARTCKGPEKTVINKKKQFQ